MTDAATRARDGWRDPMEMVVGDAEARLAAVKDSYDAEVAALRALVRSLAADARRLDWLDATNWVHLDRTDESDNNGVGLVNSAVAVRVGDGSNGPFPTLHVTAATVREAIDVAMAAANARALADAFPVPDVNERGTVTHGEDVNYVDS